jgi:hypothetical protein
VSAQLHTTLHRLGRELFKFNKVHSHSALQIAHRDLWKLARSSAHSSWELDGLKAAATHDGDAQIHFHAGGLCSA